MQTEDGASMDGALSLAGTPLRDKLRPESKSKIKREELNSAPEAKSVLAIYQIDFNFGSTAKREESVPGLKASKLLIPW